MDARPESRAYYKWRGCRLYKILLKYKPLMNDSTVIIYLPKSELPYKINHEQSKVYDVQYAFTGKLSWWMTRLWLLRNKIEKSALKMGILDQTQKNAKK